MAGNKKMELVRNTYELLKTTSPNDIKIRTIAANSNCTTTTVYKHFDDLNHLILFSSIKFLEDYIIELQNITNENMNPLDMLEAMWDSFAKYAFENVDVFDLLFWGDHKEQLGDIIYEYYQLFPNEWQHFNGLFTSVFFNDNLKERNLTIVRRNAVVGYFASDEVEMINTIEINLFHGMLMDYKDTYRNPGVPEQARQSFMNILKTIHKHFRLK